MEQFAYVMVAKLGDREVMQPGLMRGRRKDLIQHATETFFGGGYSWSYIKRQGWRIQKVKITAVKP